MERMLKAIVVAAATLTASVSLQASEADPQPIVETMRRLAGNQPHRPSGARGQCYTGEFEPTAEARSLSRAPIFTRTSQALIRFSVGGGNPNVADGSRGTNRGLSVRIDGDGPGQTEFVMVNAPMNFVRSPEQMLGFLQARLPGANGQPDAERIRAFTEANPETTQQARFLAGRPIPGSWVGVDYWAIHAYTLTNATGMNTVVKFRFAPLGGPVNLTDEEARARPPAFLAAELAERLAAGRPAGFEMLAIMSRPGDPTDNATRLWDGEDTRPTVRLGTLRVRAAADNERCDQQIFAPTILADGIAGPAEDPLFAIRTPAYAISITSRRN